VKVVVWIVEGTWRPCVRAVRDLAPADAELVLLHVTGRDAPGAAHGAFAGLLGRGHPELDPGHEVERLGGAAAEELLRMAAAELRRPSTLLNLFGRAEHEVVAAAEAADLLVLSRDGNRPGPKSFGPATRFVVDHAPCPVLLLRPDISR
jgi:nucleotide-binding universal stress UspA family protein